MTGTATDPPAPPPGPGAAISTNTTPIPTDQPPPGTSWPGPHAPTSSSHYGWIPLRTPTGTLWTSPAGQIIQVPNHTSPPPGVDHDPDLQAHLPDAADLDLLDLAQLQDADPDNSPPWLPDSERDHTTWTWIDGNNVSNDNDIAC